MGTSIKIKKRHTAGELQNHLKTIVDEKQKLRVRAIISLLKGSTRTETAHNLSVNQDSVTDWVKKYNKSGISGLETHKPGKKQGDTKWSENIFTTLTKEIDKQKQYWSLLNMTEWIKSKYKKDIPDATIWYRLQKLNYSHKSSRPSPYLGDKAKQEEFKKNRPARASERLKTA